MKKLLSLVLILTAGVMLTGCQNILELKSKAGLQVITDDVPSSVFINGQYLNSTPLIQKDLKPGTYTVRIEPNDSSLVPYETSLTLRKGLLSVITWKPADRPEMSGGVIYEMEQLADKSKTEISISTIPEGAIVTLDGRDKDFTPIDYRDISPGNQAFEVTLPSYETQSHTIFVQQGYKMVVSVKLAKLQPVDTNVPDISQPGTETATSSAETISKDQTTSLSTVLATKQYTKLKVTPTGLIIDGQEVVRVRDAAASDGEELGTAKVGDILPYTGQTFDGWHQVTFDGEVGWISSSYSELLE